MVQAMNRPYGFTLIELMITLAIAAIVLAIGVPSFQGMMRNNRTAAQTTDETVERKLVIDPQTRAIVIQKKDTRTGETVSQLPDEVLLKLRAYSRELSERARETAEANHQIERTA